ncbi:MAG: phosphopantetheine-binding protein [Polyangiaceae bacterium]
MGDLDVIRRVVKDRIADVPIDDDTPLLASGLIDSMSLVDLVLDLEQALSLSLSGRGIDPDDFASIARIAARLSAARAAP